MLSSFTGCQLEHPFRPWCFHTSNNLDESDYRSRFKNIEGVILDWSIFKFSGQLTIWKLTSKGEGHKTNLYYNSQCLFLCFSVSLSVCLSGRCNFCPGRFQSQCLYFLEITHLREGLYLFLIITRFEYQFFTKIQSFSLYNHNKNKVEL